MCKIPHCKDKFGRLGLLLVEYFCSPCKLYKCTEAYFRTISVVENKRVLISVISVGVVSNNAEDTSSLFCNVFFAFSKLRQMESNVWDKTFNCSCMLFWAWIFSRIWAVLISRREDNTKGMRDASKKANKRRILNEKIYRLMGYPFLLGRSILLIYHLCYCKPNLRHNW